MVRARHILSLRCREASGRTASAPACASTVDQVVGHGFGSFVERLRAVRSVRADTGSLESGGRRHRWWQSAGEDQGLRGGAGAEPATQCGQPAVCGTAAHVECRRRKAEADARGEQVHQTLLIRAEAWCGGSVGQPVVDPAQSAKIVAELIEQRRRGDTVHDQAGARDRGEHRGDGVVSVGQYAGRYSTGRRAAPALLDRPAGRDDLRDRGGEVGSRAFDHYQWHRSRSCGRTSAVQQT